VLGVAGVDAAGLDGSALAGSSVGFLLSFLIFTLGPHPNRDTIAVRAMNEVRSRIVNPPVYFGTAPSDYTLRRKMGSGKNA
jgi:hypothetical protein